MTRSLKGVLGAGRNRLTFGTQTVFYVFVSILTEKKELSVFFRVFFFERPELRKAGNRRLP